MKASELLLKTLDDLRKEDFETFKWYLSDNILDGCTPISQSFLEEASRPKTARKITDSYGEELAVSVSIAILKKMNMNNAAEMLKNNYTAAGGKTAATSSSSSSSASAPPVAPAAISAVGGGVVIAPNITGGSTTGALNITIHHKP